MDTKSGEPSREDVKVSAKIPDIDCECGELIAPERGASEVHCRCGRRYRLFYQGESRLYDIRRLSNENQRR